MTEQLTVGSPALTALATDWRKLLFPDASDTQFADGYAQAVTFGLLLALATGRVLSQILYDVSPNDVFALVTSSLMLTAASLLACFFPARRATKVSPMTALRTE